MSKGQTQSTWILTRLLCVKIRQRGNGGRRRGPAKVLFSKNGKGMDQSGNSAGSEKLLASGHVLRKNI